jgi:hypothetical protein
LFDQECRRRRRVVVTDASTGTLRNANLIFHCFFKINCFSSKRSLSSCPLSSALTLMTFKTPWGLGLVLTKWRHDTQHNDTQHNGLIATFTITSFTISIYCDYAECNIFIFLCRMLTKLLTNFLHSLHGLGQGILTEGEGSVQLTSSLRELFCKNSEYYFQYKMS